MFECRFVPEHVSGNCQLVISGDSAVLIDCGLPFCAKETLRNLSEYLNGRRLVGIFLSHSHYDHIAALPYIREAFPDVPVYAHAYLSQVLARPGAVKTMDAMCRVAADMFGNGYSLCPPRMEDMGDIIPLSDGERFTFGDSVMQAIFTPGHTKDSVSFDFPGEEICLICETLGVKRPDNRVHPCFLSGRGDALNSIERIAALGYRRFILQHRDVPLDKEDNDVFIELARRAILDSTELICRLYDEGQDFEGIFKGYTEIYWNELFRDGWPFPAYEMNSRAAIKTTLKELRGQ